MQSTKWVNGATWVLEVKVIPWHWPKVMQLSKFKHCYSEKLTWPFETKFHIKAHGRKEMEIYSYKFGHMTMMATMIISGKNPVKNLLLWNHWPDCLEIWNVALETWAHHNLVKWWSLRLLTLSLFYAKVTFGHLWEKVKELVHWASWSQVEYRASMGWGNGNLFEWSRSHDQDGCHAHIW